MQHTTPSSILTTLEALAGRLTDPVLAWTIRAAIDTLTGEGGEAIWPPDTTDPSALAYLTVFRAGKGVVR